MSLPALALYQLLMQNASMPLNLSYPTVDAPSIESPDLAKVKKARRARTAFTFEQLNTLEAKFKTSRLVFRLWMSHWKEAFPFCLPVQISGMEN